MPPPDALADVVECFWWGAWDLRGQAAHETHLLSDPCVHFVAERSDQPTTQGARVVGVWTRLWRRRLQDRGFVRGVKVRAGAVRAFVSLHAHAFTNRVTPLSSVFGAAAEDFEHGALTPPDPAAGCAAAAQWLLQQRRPHDPLVDEAVALVEAITAQQDILSVEALSTHAGVGVRALQKLFRQYVGGSPKWAIRRNRLQEAAARLEAGAAGSLSELAAALGYTDQAHFTRDFRAVTGRAPGRFATRVHVE